MVYVYMQTHRVKDRRQHIPTTMRLLCDAGVYSKLKMPPEIPINTLFRIFLCHKHRQTSPENVSIHCMTSACPDVQKDCDKGHDRLYRPPRAFRYAFWAYSKVSMPISVGTLVQPQQTCYWQTSLLNVYPSTVDVHDFVPRLTHWGPKILDRSTLNPL